jgi:glycosyltransferase involved in cell wall biosynthesis
MTIKVCAVVINSVSHDARVLKEAESLAQAGYDVSVVGIQDANENAPFETLENGVKIYRTAWQARTARPKYRSYLFYVMALVVLAAVLWSLPPDVAGRFWVFLGEQAARLAYHAENAPGLLALQVLVTAGLAYLGWRAYKRHRSRRATYANLREREVSVQLPLAAAEEPDAATGRPLLPLPRRLFLLLQFPINFDLVSRQGMVIERERAIADLCITLGPEVVHCHDIGALPVGILVKEATGCRIVFDAHEIYDQLAQTSAAERALNRHIARLHGDKVDAFVTINDSIATYYQRNFPFLPAPVVIRNAVHRAEPFDYDGRLHEAAGLSADAKILLYQGGFARHRGLVQLVQAAPLLPEGWTLVMMGWGRFEAELVRIARSGAATTMRKTQRSRYHRLENPSSRVRFVGRAPQEELARWSAGATIGVIPYENIGLNHWFCTPNKLWEYPNAGVPILASPFPEMRNIIEGYGVGWLLPLRLTPEGVAATVAKISDEEIAVCRANCSAFVREDNWSIYGRRLVNMYDKLAGAGQAAGEVVRVPAALSERGGKAAA